MKTEEETIIIIAANAKCLHPEEAVSMLPDVQRCKNTSSVNFITLEIRSLTQGQL